MEENVALDSSKQKQFVKSVRGIKKLLKKEIEKGPLVSKQKPKASEDKNEENTEKPKQKNIRRRKNRGLVYLSHIPHGFYEHQMTEYFKQFGVVTNARVIRSKRTGNSKGFAFVEFKEPSVAEVVAETMNNYLMGKRLIKAVYIPPEKQILHAFRKNWNNQTNPASDHRLKIKKAFNADKTDVMELKIARKLMSNLSKTKAKLRKLGIDYDFKPVDIPEVLNKEIENIETTVKETKSMKKKKVGKSENEQENIKVESEETQKVKVNSKNKKCNKKNKQSDLIKAEQESNKLGLMSKTKVEENDKVNKKVQKSKQNKLKADNIKLPENFISIREDSESDDDNDEFDSDEFEKMIGDDDDGMSSGDESKESIDNDSDELRDEYIEPEVKKRHDTKENKKKPVPALKNGNKSGPMTKTKQEQVHITSVTMKTKKRKNVQNSLKPQKKVKFEKQNNNKALKKAMKKKK